MSSLARRVEALKLAAALGVEADELPDLTDVPPETIRTLRSAYGEAVFTQHESRFRRIGKVAASVPAAVAGRIAQVALPPALAARVAAVMEPATAIRLASSLSVDYLTDLSIALDPVRATPILEGIAPKTVVGVGRRLLERGEHLTLGRFVSVIAPETALQVVEHAAGRDLIQVALFADDPTALDGLVRRIDDTTLIQAIRAAHEEDLYEDALTLVSAVSEESRGRLVALITQLDDPAVAGFIRSVQEYDAWPVVLPTLAGLDEEALARVVNSPGTLSADVLPRAVEVATELGLGELVERLPELLDEEHRAALPS